MRKRVVPSLFMASLALCLAPQPARADVTAFLGATATPSSRPVRGVAVGVGLLVLGFEFEYASTQEDTSMSAPSLLTGMANVLLQTPTNASGLQLYGTIGTGVYRERLGTTQETSLGFNSGGGAKIALFGPLRGRLDYRVFSLRGNPLHPRVHRFYAGANLKF